MIYLDALVRVDVDRWCRAKASKDLLGGTCKLREFQYPASILFFCLTLVLRDVVEAEEAARASVLSLSRSRLPALELLRLLLLLLLRPLVAELLRLRLLGLTELLLLGLAELLLLRLRTAEAQEPCVGGSSSWRRRSSR